MRTMLDQVLVTYWPFWLLAGTFLLAGLRVRWEARAPLPALDEHAVAAAGRPHPAPIDVTPIAREATDA